MKQMHTTNELIKSTQKDRPSVTFFLFAYNQEKYIEEACKAALVQTYSPLEIIFSDDCSSDKTFELMQKTVENYNGPHQIKLNRNNKNLGLIDHVNKSFEISMGELIVVAAGDDISLPHRVECLIDAYQRNDKKALVIHSSVMKINDSNDELGIKIPPVIVTPMTTGDLADSQGLYIGATAAWSRSVYTEFGPIFFKNSYEDLILGFRAAIKDSLLYVDKPLVRYRVDVGLSAKALIPILKFKIRIAIRKKRLNVALDVYTQRLRDICHIDELDKDGVLKARLVRNINFQNKRLLFYHNPLILSFHIFSKDFIEVLRAFNSEVKYLVGLNG